MGNPVRPWRNFLTAWEKLDDEALREYVAHATRTLTKLRAFRKDIDSRIAYWEDGLAMPMAPTPKAARSRPKPWGPT